MEEDESLIASLRRDNLRILAVPLELAAEPLSVLVKDPVRLHRALVPMLDPPEYSSHFFVERAGAQVRDRNHFALHRVREIRRGSGAVRRTQCDLLALFHTRIPA